MPWRGGQGFPCVYASASGLDVKHFEAWQEAFRGLWQRAETERVGELMALPSAVRWLPLRAWGRCVGGAGSSWTRAPAWAWGNPLSIGRGSSVRLLDCCMAGRAKPIRPCHRYGMWTCYWRFSGEIDIVKIRNLNLICKCFLLYFTLIRTKTDINGRKQTLTDIAVLRCCIFA